MKNENVVVLKDKKGKNKTFKIIASFENESGDEIIIYTDNKKDTDGFIKAYAGIYDEDKLLPIENDDDYQIIENILNKIDEE